MRSRGEREVSYRKTERLINVRFEYWIPTARLVTDELEITLAYCAPPGSRGAVIRMTMTNRGTEPVPVTLGMRASWGSLSRVTYVPVELHGTLSAGPAPWVEPGEVFSIITDDPSWAPTKPP